MSAHCGAGDTVMSAAAPNRSRPRSGRSLAVLLAPAERRDVQHRLPAHGPDPARGHADRVERAVADLVQAVVGEPRDLRRDAQRGELRLRVAPVERHAVRVPVAIAADGELAVRVGAVERVAAGLPARAQRRRALRDVEVARARVELAVGDQAAVDADARRDRMGDLHAAREPAEARALLDAEARDRHDPEHGQRDVRLRDAGVDVAVVAGAHLDDAEHARAVLRFARLRAPRGSGRCRRARRQADRPRAPPRTRAATPRRRRRRSRRERARAGRARRRGSAARSARSRARPRPGGPCRPRRRRTRGRPRDGPCGRSRRTRARPPRSARARPGP